ncbi:male sterility protein [Nocardia tenerifensis]|uniref:Male sterility protein n=1 Tax=Nocardia tenerifensis TaxID=228006 RepID=A0A318JZP2_9NOCA|nr:alpha/beta fold hydrolase [Nocardia tenerifensis]PXX64152.1 male sterility protein [Nocardia tenerifensis]
MSHSIVLGAAGFIGRAAVARLLEQGDSVVAALRPGGENRLDEWLRARAVDRTGLTVVLCDVTATDLGLPADLDTSGIRDVYNCAARFAFGLDEADAYAVNVTGALNVLDWAAALPALRRVVHITGYRVTTEGSGEPRSARGAYEGSKLESDPLLRRRAAERGLPLTITNPSGVLGPGQYIGLASLVEDLWRGRLAAIPGGRETFVPIVDLDYFASFLVGLPSQEDTVGRSFTVLDPRTPVLPDLIRLLAGHMGVRAPRLTIPVGVIERLPRALTGADPETLAFIADDRYDTAAADEVARRTGLTMPRAETVLHEWADHLVASRFGAVEADPTAGFVDGTWVSGDRAHPAYVLLHGLPVDSESWSEVRDALGAPSLVADLPGLGRSAPGDIDDVLPRLMGSVQSRPVLVGHSLGCGPVLKYAAAHPDRIAGVVLVSPAFLQPPAGRLLRSPLAAPALRRMSVEALASRLGIPAGPAVDSAAANLRRPGVAGRTIAALRRAGAPGRRAELAETLARVAVPVRIVVGARDPFPSIAPGEPAVIEDAGHYPQLTHPALVAAEITRLGADRLGAVAR